MYLAKKFLDTGGDLMKLRHEIQCILPLDWSPAECMQVQIEAKDWVPFENSKFQLTSLYKAPLMKNMPSNYRLRLKPNSEDEEPKKRLVKKKPTNSVSRPVRKRKTKPSEEVIEVSDSEIKAKKFKQQKLQSMKKVNRNIFLCLIFSF